MTTKTVIISTLAILLVGLPALAQATVHVVGDSHGWTFDFDYNAWAKGRHFRVGDTLVFKYPVGYHNVYKVGGSDFDACKVPPGSEALATGYDVINLSTTGRKWYICGKANGYHCNRGQKLFLVVLPAAWKAPPTHTPPHQPTQHIVGDSYGWTLNFNYEAWAKGRVFRVGDSLVFRYPKGNHNVFKVGGPEFQACSVPAESEALTSGYDVINLTTPGRKWYICGKGNGQHCKWGQKLLITVHPAGWQP